MAQTAAPSPLSGWLPAEVTVLTHVHEVLDRGLLRLRYGSRARRIAETERKQTLAAAGLDEADFETWAGGGVHPRRGLAVTLAEDERLVALPAGYDDVRDRGRLVAKLAGAIPGDPQVETIIWSPDRSRCAAVVVQGTTAASWRPHGEAHAIPAGVRDAGQVDAHLREQGRTLLVLTPPAPGCLPANSPRSSWPCGIAWPPCSNAPRGRCG